MHFKCLKHSYRLMNKKLLRNCHSCHTPSRFLLSYSKNKSNCFSILYLFFYNRINVKMTSLIYICSIFICKLMCRLICKIHTPSPTHKMYLYISFVLLFVSWINLSLIKKTTQNARIHFMTLYLLIHNILCVCSFLFKHKKKQ